MNILKDTAYPVDQTGYPNFSITAITVICPIVPVKYNLIAFFLSTELSMSSSFVSQNMYNSFTLLRQQIEPNQIHLIKQIPETRINTGFRHFNPVPGHTPLSSKGKIQYPHYPHIPLQNHTAKPHCKTLRHCSAIPQHIPQW